MQLGRPTLPVEVRHLVAQVVHVPAEVRHPALQLGALAPDAVELLALCADARLAPTAPVRLRASAAPSPAARRAYALARVRPGVGASPPRPRCRPARSSRRTAGPARARRASKKTVSITYLLISVCASHVSSSASTPPSTPFANPSIRKGRRMYAVGRADQPHDRDLTRARQHRHADRRADDDHRDDGEREPEREPGDPGDVAQAVELLDPLLAVADVVDERERLHPRRRRASPWPGRA